MLDSIAQWIYDLLPKSTTFYFLLAVGLLLYGLLGDDKPKEKKDKAEPVDKSSDIPRPKVRSFGDLFRLLDYYSTPREVREMYKQDDGREVSDYTIKFQEYQTRLFPAPYLSIQGAWIYIVRDVMKKQLPDMPPFPPKTNEHIEAIKQRHKVQNRPLITVDNTYNQLEVLYRRFVHALPQSLIAYKSESDVRHHKRDFEMPFTEYVLNGDLLPATELLQHSGYLFQLDEIPDGIPPPHRQVSDEIRRSYEFFRQTALHHLMRVSIPVELSNRTEHMHVLGGSGHGKTQLIQYMVSKDLEEDCTVIVIDSQRQMIPKLAHIDIEGITYINPSWNLGINLFDVGYENLSETEVNRAVELLQFVLGSMIEANLTPKQQLIFQYAIQLCIAVPDGNIHTFLNILDDHTEYAEYVERQPSHVREFFNREFGDRQYRDTKKEISWRVWSMLKNPTFARIFSATRNPVDMYRQMDEQKLILIDTHYELLQSASGLFGRTFLAQILQAASRRFQGHHRRVYLYVDEAYQYFDKNLGQMLETARKANIGIILAHQHLGQLGDLYPTVMANTGIKFAGGVSSQDAQNMAGAMHTKADLIKSQPKLQFATYIKGQGTYSVKVPAGVIENMPKRSSLTELCSEMEEAYGVTEHPPIPESEKDDEEIRPGGKL